MILIITEKKSAADDLCKDFLTIKYNGEFKKGKNYHTLISGNNEFVITWASGHLYRLKEPDEYDDKYKKWDIEHLPIFFPLELDIVRKLETVETKGQKPQKVFSEEKRILDQIDTIKKFLTKAKEIVHYGDAGREGQLIIDEILIELKNKKPVKRLWINGNSFEEYQEAWDKMKDNKHFVGYYNSAIARQWADWYVGMNYSRLLTCMYPILYPNKTKFTISIGRLQTPVLRMIYKRESDIANFKPKDFFNVKAIVKTGESNSTLSLITKKDQYKDYCDEEFRIIEPKLIDMINADIPKGSLAKITELKINEVSRKHPSQFSLPKLQSEISSKLKISLKEVKDIVQDLYESKLITYPRTDCSYLTDAQFDKVEGVFEQLKSFPHLKDYLIPKEKFYKSDCFNTLKTKEFDHYAIHPNLANYEVYQKLGSAHQYVFDTIAQRYIQSVYPKKVDEEIILVVESNNHSFKNTVKKNLIKGWDIYSEDEDCSNLEFIELKKLKNDDMLSIENLEITTSKTTPPKLFTYSSIIDALISIHKYLEEEKIQIKDLDAYKEILKSKSGLGTSATRDEIVSVLERKEYILIKNKEQLTVSEQGKNLLNFIGTLQLPELASPIATARMEEKLTLIEKGKYTKEEFLNNFHSIISRDIEKVKNFKLG